MSNTTHFAKIKPRVGKWYALCGADRKGEWMGAFSRSEVDCAACLRRLDALIAKGKPPSQYSSEEKK